jgi:hypothetical protein
MESIAKDAFLAAVADTEFHDKWMTSDTWAELICLRYNLVNSNAFTGIDLNKVFQSRSSLYLTTQMDVDRSNIPLDHIGIFRDRYKDPATNKKRVCYYACEKGRAPKITKGVKWFHEVTEAIELKTKFKTRKEKRVLVVNGTIVSQNSNKRKIEEVQAAINETIAAASAAPSSASTTTALCSAIPSSDHSIFWQSTEAQAIFQPKEGETVLEAIQNQINTLHEALSSHLLITSIIEGNCEHMTENQTIAMRERCQIIALALSVAIDNLPVWKNWNRCCEVAVGIASKMGIVTSRNARVVRNWYQKFRVKRKFQLRASVKHDLPPFLERNKEICISLKTYIREHLAELSSEMVCEYLHNTVLPMLVKEDIGLERESDGYVDAVRTVLGKYGLTKICPSTCYNWLRQLGFTYCTQKKGYFVDGHEKPATVAYRANFISRYFECERRTHRWIQLSHSQALDLQENEKILKNTGFSYKDSSDNQMVEFHVDDLKLFQQEMNEKNGFGGRLSVRFPNHLKPLIIIGHDECIFKQYSLSKKYWVAPDGQRVLVPKDEGQGVMVSAFQSREFGFGLELTPEQLNVVNQARRGTKYKDEESAISRLGTAIKKDLPKSPFVKEFEYGASNEGYWCYEHMVLQFEDVVDCLMVLFPQYDYLFMFDHSCGHDKQREDGLNVQRMSKLYGGKQPKMRDTVITHEKGFLGPFTKTLRVGDTQSLVFKAADSGPFWLSIEERERKRNDILKEGIKQVKQTKKELIKALEQKGIIASGKAADIKKLAENNGILTVLQEQKKEEGWEGRPKGMLQILWERGWIDDRRLNDYTVNGKKDALGTTINETSLKYLLGNCEDFINEESMLQYYGRMMGVAVDRTPKCHCELAGEGIEYSWAASKNKYRRFPVSQKKGKEQFRKLVSECLSREVVTTELVRAFSRRARQYICAYHALHEQQQSSKDAATEEITAPLIEKLVKKFKTHRAVIDFDNKFVTATVKMEEELSSEVRSIGE